MRGVTASAGSSTSLPPCSSHSAAPPCTARPPPAAPRQTSAGTAPSPRTHATHHPHVTPPPFPSITPNPYQIRAMAAPLLRHLRHTPPPGRPPPSHVFFGSAKGRPTRRPCFCPPPPPAQSAGCVRCSAGLCPRPAAERSSVSSACAPVACDGGGSSSVGWSAGGGSSSSGSVGAPCLLFPLFSLWHSDSVLHNSGGSSSSGGSLRRLRSRGVAVRSRKGGYYKCQWALCALGASSSSSSSAAAAAS
jgi:hypothetical protein